MKWMERPCSVVKVEDVMQNDRYIRKPEAARITGLSEVTLWRLEREGKFCQRRQLSKNSVGYLLSEVNAWMEARPVSDPSNPAQGEAA